MLPQRTVLLALLLLALSDRGLTSSTSHVPMNEQQALAKCAAYQDLFTNIHSDLARWQQDGISLALMQQSVAHHTTRQRFQKGFHAGFRNGSAYLLEKPNLDNVGHHAQLLFIYLRVLAHLEQEFQMPDVDFVINTLDRPLEIAPNASSTDLPVLRFCKTRSQADILIPIFHFHMKDYDGSVLEQVPKVNETHPWESKEDKLFGRFSLYTRHYHVSDPAVPRRSGVGGAHICAASKQTSACAVRKHFVEFCNEHRHDGLDVQSAGFVSMLDHAKYKYLAHLDGQGLSSRLDTILALNSLVVKEDSGYYAFYHHLLKPYEHYVPFWKERPEEVLEVLKWAREHDDEARQIAANGQRLVLKYLNQHARACYWYVLLTELSKLLRYKLGPVPGQRRVMEYLNDVAPGHGDGRPWKVLQNFKP